MREGHGVGLVAHAQTLQMVLPGIAERVANDALHALSGVDVLLNGNFVGGALLEDSANADIQTFGVLPKDHQADVFFGPVAKRREPLVKQLDWPGVDIEVQFRSQAKQNVGRMLIGRDARTAKGAKENGVKFIPE